MSLACYKIFQYVTFFHNDVDMSGALIAMSGFNQGIQFLSDLAIQYMFKDVYGLSPALAGVLHSYIYSPWMIKPLWGSITDSKPVFGYKRKPYLIFFSLLNCILWVLMANYGQNNLYLALCILTLIQLCICFGNVIGEAVVVQETAKAKREVEAISNNLTEEEKQKLQQKTATFYVSLFFGVRAVGFLIGAYFSGFLLNYISIREIFLMCSVFPLILFVISSIYKDQLSESAPISIFQTFNDFWKFFQNPIIWQPILLLFLFSATPHSSSIFFYFYTIVLEFPPDFMGTLRLMYAIATIAGVLVYNKFLKDVPFKKIFLTSTLGYYLCYQSMIILVTRKNVEWGINDKVFCIGDQIVMQFVGELNSLPVLILACKMCPKNIEATMYALVTSSLNMGSLIGTQLGSLLLIILNIDQNNFSLLWLFILITGIAMLIPLPWVYVVREQEIEKYKEVKQIGDEQPSMIHPIMDEDLMNNRYSDPIK